MSRQFARELGRQSCLFESSLEPRHLVRGDQRAFGRNSHPQVPSNLWIGEQTIQNTRIGRLDDRQIAMYNGLFLVLTTHGAMTRQAVGIQKGIKAG